MVELPLASQAWHVLASALASLYGRGRISNGRRRSRASRRSARRGRAHPDGRGPTPSPVLRDCRSSTRDSVERRTVWVRRCRRRLLVHAYSTGAASTRAMIRRTPARTRPGSTPNARSVRFANGFRWQSHICFDVINIRICNCLSPRYERLPTGGAPWTPPKLQGANRERRCRCDRSVRSGPEAVRLVTGVTSKSAEPRSP